MDRSQRVTLLTTALQLAINIPSKIPLRASKYYIERSTWLTQDKIKAAHAVDAYSGYAGADHEKY